MFLIMFVLPVAFSDEGAAGGGGGGSSSGGSSGGGGSGGGGSNSGGGSSGSDNSSTICNDTLTTCVVPSASGGGGGGAGVASPQPTLVSENPTAVATSTVSGGQSMATLVHNANAISAEEISAISENVTVTPTEIVSGATKIVSASNTSASGKMIQISVNGKEITVTPSISTVVIKDGEVIVNTTEIHLKNGKMFMGNTEVNVTPQQAKDKIETKLQAKIEKFELKNINGKALYAMEIKEQRRLFGLFPLRATITEEVDATTGKLVKDVRPWWYAFSTEQPTIG